MNPGGEPVAIETAIAPGVQIWRVDIDDTAEPDRASLVDLTPDERFRLSNYARTADRARFAATRTALRRRLGERLGLPAQDVEVTVDPQGKPRLADDAIWFNVSHAGRCGLVALSSSGPVGVDVECADVEPPLDPLVRLVLSPTEQRLWGQLKDGGERMALFLSIWTAKEAFLKAAGTGFLVDPRKVTVIGERGPLAPKGRFPNVDPSTALIRPLPAPAGYVAAFATLAGSPSAMPLDGSALGMEYSRA